MKKGFIFSFTPVTLIVILVGLIVLFTFLGRDGHITTAVSKVPEFINKILGEVEKFRNPEANTLDFYSNIRNAYNFRNEVDYGEVCFYELDKADLRLLEGYVHLKKNNNKIEYALKLEDQSQININPMEADAELCVLRGPVAEELVKELNERDMLIRTMINIERGAVNTYRRFRAWLNNNPGQYEEFEGRQFILETDFEKVNEIKISISNQGAYQIRIGNSDVGYDFSKYMVYYNGSLCFIPITRRFYADCYYLSGVMTHRCTNRLKYFEC